MNVRFSRRAIGIFAIASVLCSAGTSLAVFFPLGPSKDEWGLKYQVQLTEAGGDTVNVALAVSDEGRLGPVYSYTVVAFSPRPGGSQAYDVKSKIELQTLADGRRGGQVRIRRDLVGKAMIRVLTLNVDGKPQTAGARLYDIPLNRYPIQAAPAGTQPAAAPTTPAAAAASPVAKPAAKPLIATPAVETPSTISPSAAGSRGRFGRLF